MIYFGADIKSLSFNGRSFAEAYLGSDLVWKAHYNPVAHRFTKANTYHLTVPHWANTIDYVLIGGAVAVVLVTELGEVLVKAGLQGESKPALSGCHRGE
ncbi:hypothetical protein D9R19_05625 [Corynebacterium diphtheriae]|nr:hypothetical protein D9R19_05625 [Corynebacterium diphtheriae]